MSPNANQLLRSLLCVPVASTAVFNGAMPQPTPVWQGQDVAWAFHHENVLGTSMAVTLRAANRTEADGAEAALLSSIDREDLILSSWRRESWNRESWNRESEVSRWLATRGNPVNVSAELLEVLGRFDYWREATGGALDASAETAVRLWQRAAAEHRQPTQTEIERAVEAMQQTHWQVDRLRGAAIHLTDTPVALASLTKSYIAGHAADAALAAGATGVMLNIGGDIVVRGELAQIVDIANPLASAENDVAIDRILVRDRAVATSGSYRRGFNLTATPSAAQPEFSHIIDPRTARPAEHILSSTVVAKDPATAGALATAFSVLGVDESRSLAASLPTKHGGVEYLLFTRDGERVASDGWRAYQAPSLRTAAYAAPPTPADKSVWNQNYELDINLELARIDDFRYRRPYVAVWVEGQDHLPVRTIAVWSGKPRYLPELRSWYHTAQLRGNEDDIMRTVSSATRSPGSYTLKWDGKDDEGNFVKSGEYTIYIEVAREHGTYQILRQPMDFSGQPKQVTLPAGSEIGGATLDYHKR